MAMPMFKIVHTYTSSLCFYIDYILSAYLPRDEVVRPWWRCFELHGCRILQSNGFVLPQSRPLQYHHQFERREILLQKYKVSNQVVLY